MPQGKSVHESVKRMLPPNALVGSTAVTYFQQNSTTNHRIIYERVEIFKHRIYKGMTIDRMGTTL